MGKTSAAVKNKYNEKAYDRINLVVPKGQKAKIKEYAESKGISTNAFIVAAIEDAINK
jgi:predicted HicB family RNase H-like nuclease